MINIHQEQKAFFDILDKAEITYVNDPNDLNSKEIPVMIGIVTGWGDKMHILIHPKETD